MRKVRFTVNGGAAEVDIDDRETLADVLRERLGLTGTHLGCEQGVCGSCTVIADGAALRSCLVLAAQCEGWNVTTIEGIAAGDRLHPVQRAFHEHHALQCGFCTPGFVTLFVAELERDPALDEERLMELVGSNLCRCTGYTSIVAALRDAAGAMRSQPSSSRIAGSG